MSSRKGSKADHSGGTGLADKALSELASVEREFADRRAEALKKVTDEANSIMKRLVEIKKAMQQMGVDVKPITYADGGIEISLSSPGQIFRERGSITNTIEQVIKDAGPDGIAAHEVSRICSDTHGMSTKDVSGGLQALRRKEAVVFRECKDRARGWFYIHKDLLEEPAKEEKKEEKHAKSSPKSRGKRR